MSTNKTFSRHCCALSLCALMCVLALVPATSARSDVRKITADIDLHYNALPSVDIPAQVMKNYGLKRSKNLGLLNISLVAIGDDPMGGPPLRRGIEADKVSCTATNLNNQQRDLDVSTVKSGEAIYHLALFPIENKEKIQFSCSIDVPEAATPELDQDERSISLDFSKGFHIDP